MFTEMDPTGSISIPYREYLQGILSPDKLHATLQECVARKNLKAGRKVHSLLMACGYSSATSLGDHLVRFFILCRSLLEANLAFASIKIPSVETWQVIIEVHAQLQGHKKSIELFHMMKQDGVVPNRGISRCILKACAILKDVNLGLAIHEHIRNSALASHTGLATEVIDMYAKCGDLNRTETVFMEIQHQNIITYNAMISAYANHGCQSLAVKVFEEMQVNGIEPDEVSYMSMIKACSAAGNLQHARRLHGQVMQLGLDMNIVIGSSIVDFYCKHGNVIDARKVFDELKNKDIILWCTMISGYTESGNNYMALRLFEDMQRLEINLDKVAFSCVLKACAGMGNLEESRYIHDLVIRNQFESDVVVGSALVDIYARSGSTEEAHKVFSNLEKRNVVSWGAMIAGYVQVGDGKSALNMFMSMQEQGIRPSSFIFSCTLKACGIIGDSQLGMKMHWQVICTSLESDIVIANSLIDMYVKCGHLDDARAEFDHLPSLQDAVPWATMISGYADHGCTNNALQLLSRMQQHDVIPDKVTLVSALKVCASVGALVRGMLIHYIIIDFDILTDVLIGNTLVAMYAKCGTLVEAWNVFERLSDKDIVSWSALITGFAESEEGIVALELFDKMVEKDITADRAMFLSILKACCYRGIAGYVRIAHHHITKHNILSDIRIGNMLISSYSKFGLFEEAEKVFNQMPITDLISYNSLLTGKLSYTSYRPNMLAFLSRMKHDSILPNDVTYSSALTSCGNNTDIKIGFFIHNELISNGVQINMDIGITLVNMYLKCGRLKEAQDVFNRLPYQNIISWGVMIAGYVQHDQEFLALLLFEKMQADGIQPNDIIISSALKACSRVGAYTQGHWIHDRIIRNGQERDAVIGSGLVDMYSRYGALIDAYKALNTVVSCDTAVWGAMIAGYAKSGNFTLVEHCLQKMQEHGLRPDASTYSCILNACSREGRLNEGFKHFSLAVDKKTITQDIYFNSILHLLGSVGHIHKAEELLKSAPFSPNPICQTSLLSACTSYGNINLAGKSFEQIVSSDSAILIKEMGS